MTRATRSFLILFLLALSASFVAFKLTRLNQETDPGIFNFHIKTQQTHGNEPTSNQEIPLLDTADWKTHTDAGAKVAFKYPPKWTVQSFDKNPDYYILVINPGKKWDNMRVYVSSKSYFAIKDLPSRPFTVSGVDGININNMIIGAKTGEYYYTFDVGLNPTLLPEFLTIVQSVEFTK